MTSGKQYAMVRTRWWVPTYLAVGQVVLLAMAPFMTEDAIEAYTDGVVAFIDRHGLEVIG